MESDTEDDDGEEEESDEESEEEVPVKETKADAAPKAQLTITKIGKKDKAFANEGKPAKNEKK